jgi:hypothetical protein
LNLSLGCHAVASRDCKAVIGIAAEMLIALHILIIATPKKRELIAVNGNLHKINAPARRVLEIVASFRFRYVVLSGIPLPKK